MKKSLFALLSGLFLAGCAHQPPAPPAAKPAQPRTAPQCSMKITVPEEKTAAVSASGQQRSPAPVAIAVNPAPVATAVNPAPAIVSAPPAATAPSKAPAAPRPRKQVRALVFIQNNTRHAQELQGLRDLVTGELANRNILAVDPGRFSPEWKDGRADLNSLPKSSIIGLAQTLRTPYVIMASLNRLDASTIGTAPNTFTQYHLKLSLNISTNDGAVFDSWTATVKSRPMTPLQLKQNSEFALHQLMDKAAVECADWLTMRIDSRETLPESVYKYVMVDFSCNIPGADLEIDGTAVGTAPAKCKILEGLHTLRVSYPYFIEYRKQVNFSEGARFDIVLEMSDAGIARWQSQELFKTILQRIKDSGATDDAVRKVMAEGQAQYLKNSHFRWDGAIDALSIFDQNNQFDRAYMDFSNDDLIRWNSPDNLLRIVGELRKAGVSDNIIRTVRQTGSLKDYDNARLLWNDRTGSLGVRTQSGRNFIVK